MLTTLRSTSPARFISTSTTAALSAAVLALTLGACGSATPVTVTPAGDAVTVVPTSTPPAATTPLPTSSASAPDPGSDSGETSLSVPGGGVSVDGDGNASVSVPGGGVSVGSDGGASVSIPGMGDSRIGTFGSTGTVTLKGGLKGSPTVSTAKCNAAGGPRTLTATLEGGLELRVDIVSAEIATVTITKGKAEWRADYVTNFGDFSTLDTAAFTVKGAQLNPDEDIDTGVAVATGVVTLEASFDC